MSNIPKTLNIQKPTFKTLPEANKFIDDMIKQLDLMFRHTRSDIEKLESRMTSAEARITALEP